ncbi:hypothetical protein [Deinococcus aquatilis]|uniref:hypothetical protein n=1 Tax=Deinococcus aquatilis TaxID=519440 RepID=UPI000380E4A8|nr:hypothetical protein [Deinococcus aquatilis]
MTKVILPTNEQTILAVKRPQGPPSAALRAQIVAHAVSSLRLEGVEITPEQSSALQEQHDTSGQ